MFLELTSLVHKHRRRLAPLLAHSHCTCLVGSLWKAQPAVWCLLTGSMAEEKNLSNPWCCISKLLCQRGEGFWDVTLWFFIHNGWHPRTRKAMGENLPPRPFIPISVYFQVSDRLHVLFERVCVCTRGFVRFEWVCVYLSYCMLTLAGPSRALCSQGGFPHRSCFSRSRLPPAYLGGGGERGARWVMTITEELSSHVLLHQPRV